MSAPVSLCNQFGCLHVCIISKPVASGTVWQEQQYIWQLSILLQLFFFFFLGGPVNESEKQAIDLVWPQVGSGTIEKHTSCSLELHCRAGKLEVLMGEDRAEGDSVIVVP